MFDFFKSMLSSEPPVDLAAVYKKGAVIIDVRTAGEYAEGHVKGSRNIPLDRIGSEVQKIKAMNKPVITCCRSGARSAQAAGVLQAQGIEVYNGGPWQSVQQAIQG